MRLPGYCTECNMPRQVQVSGSALMQAQARGQLHRVRGVCVECQRKQEHERNPRPDDLHHPNGEHRTTPPTANGHLLALHERKLLRHLADGHVHRPR